MDVIKVLISPPFLDVRDQAISNQRETRNGPIQPIVNFFFPRRNLALNLKPQ